MTPSSALRPLALLLLAAPLAAAPPGGGSTEQFAIPSIPFTNTSANLSYLGPNEGCVVTARMHLEFTPAGGFDASQVEVRLATPVLPGLPEWVVVAGSDLGWSGTTGTFVANLETHAVDGPFDAGGPGSFSLWEVKVGRVGGGGITGQFQASFAEVDVLPGCAFGLLFCAGDGSGAPCPCGNAGLPGHGCANGAGGGALLQAFGSASVADGAFLLSATGLPASQPALFFQGLNAVNGGAGAAFGDGLRCAGGGVVRLETGTSDGAGELATAADLLAAGGVAAGQLRRYQAWYRDPLGTPCGAGFNTTNGVEVLWAP